MASGREALEVTQVGESFCGCPLERGGIARSQLTQMWIELAISLSESYRGWVDTNFDPRQVLKDAKDDSFVSATLRFGKGRSGQQTVVDDQGR
jgi:hypothetical protein